MNAHSGYESENWNVLIYATNTFDVDYITAGDTTFVTVGDPLQFGIQDDVQF